MSQVDRQNPGVPGTMGDASLEHVAAQVDRQSDVLGDQVEEVAAQMAQLTEALVETHRTRGEQAQEGGERWLTTVLNSILSGVLVVDPESRCIVDVNATAARLIGLPREQIVGKTCHRFVCPAEQGCCPIADLGQCVDLAERVLVTGNGERVPVVKTVVAAQWKGRSYLIESFIDISGWKRAHQRQVDLVQQMENANKELTDFAHVVSHDLKAPLRGIKTLAGWIAADSAERLDPEGREQLSLLLSRVTRMEDLINGILQYSRAGRPTEEGQGMVDLGEVVPSIVDMVACLPHVTVSIEGPLPQVRADKTRISQVFQNLLSNAVKFKDKPDGLIRIGCADDGEFWRFSVSDNGPGIEEKYFEKIFKLFQTLAPRDDFESSGVGLAVVKKIVAFYGGTVWVESKVGQGSTFFFTFPKAKGPVQTLREPGPSDSQAQAADR